MAYDIMMLFIDISIHSLRAEVDGIWQPDKNGLGIFQSTPSVRR